MVELVADAKIFAQHIVVALDCLGEMEAMRNIFTSQEHQEQYKKASHFYFTAYHAMQYRVQMIIANLFDNSGKSFDTFKNTVCKNTSLFNFSDYVNKKKAAQQDINAIRTIRNKFLAHPDKAYFNCPETVYDNNPFSFQTIEKLLFSMLCLCNKIILYYDKAVPAQLFSAYNRDDFIKLFGYKTEDDMHLESWLENGVTSP